MAWRKNRIEPIRKLDRPSEPEENKLSSHTYTGRVSSIVFSLNSSESCLEKYMR